MSTLVTIVGGIKSRPHTQRKIEFVNLHEDFPREVNKAFVSQPSDQGKGSSDPLGPPALPRYFRF